MECASPSDGARPYDCHWPPCGWLHCHRARFREMIEDGHGQRRNPMTGAGKDKGKRAVDTVRAWGNGYVAQAKTTVGKNAERGLRRNKGRIRLSRQVFQRQSQSLQQALFPDGLEIEPRGSERWAGTHGRFASEHLRGGCHPPHHRTKVP